MALYDDPTLDPNATSFVDGEDPFLSWYHGAPPAPGPPVAPPVDDPNEIQMPAENARPTLGFPTVPDAPIEPEQLNDDPFRVPPEVVPAVDVGPPSVDAISGGSVTPTAQTATPLSDAPGSALEVPGAPQMHGDALTQEQRAQMYRRSSPEDQARSAQAYRDQYEAHERELRDRADLEQRQREVENHAAIQKSIGDARAATEKLNADAAKLANEELDTSWHAGPGKRIAGIILGIIGGLVQSRQGGANQGLAIIDADLANQIEARKLKMANKRAELARRGATIQQLLGFDMQQHEESVRYGVATYERAKADIASQMQQFDPQGKAAIQLGQTYAAIDQAKAKALAEYESSYQKNWVEMYKLDQEDRKIAVSQGELALKQAKAAGMGGGPAKVKPEDVVQPPEYYASRGLVAPPVPMSEKQYKGWQPLKKGSQEITAAESQGQSKEEAERGIPGLKNPDGTPFIWQGRAEDAQAFKKKKVAAEKIVRMIDDALATRTGWSSDVGNSKERQELAVLWGNATVEAKNMAELGQLTEGDTKLIVGILGTNDPSKFRDPTDGMKKARQVIIDNLRQELKDSGGFKGSYDRPYITPTKPKPTADDKAQQESMKAQDAGEIIEAGLTLPKAKSLQGLADEVKYGKGSDTKDAEQVAIEQGVAGDVPPAAKAHIDKLAQQLDDPKEAETAQAMLLELTGAPVPATANYARQVMQSHLLSGQQRAIDQSGPVTSVSYEEAPPRPAKEPNKPKKKGGR